MTATLKRVFFGILIGALIGFPLGMNQGRERPLLSNPFGPVDVKHSVKVGAENMIEDTRAAIHDATKPANAKPVAASVKK